MWIRGQVLPELGRKGLEYVRVIWDIDELTSAAIILDYDTDRDGVLSPVETEALRRGVFEHLIEQEYYMFVEVRDMLATPDAPGTSVPILKTAVFSTIFGFPWRFQSDGKKWQM